MRTTQLSLLALAVLLGAISSACSDEGGESPGETLAEPLTNAAAAPIGAEALEQMRALAEEKRSRTPAQRKLGSQLLLAAKSRRGDPQMRSLSTLSNNVKLSSSGTVLVDIKAHVDAALLERIRALGGTIVASVPRFDAIGAEVPLDQVEVLAAEPNVRSIMPALGWVTNKDDTTEGDVAHKADAARALSGMTGAGVMIGVISDGVQTLAARQASGDLPAAPQLQVLAGQAGSGDEGTAMLEIVHDLAPGASLRFATALPIAAQFAQNILDLRTAGCDIIVDDVAYLGEAAFQDDVIADAVNSVTADGALFFSAAGNDGTFSEGTASGYEGDYVPISPPNPIDNDTWPDVHEFDGLRYNRIVFDPPSVITLQWSDPYGASTNDYDLFLLHPTNATVVAASTGSQSGTEDPLEFIGSVNPVTQVNINHLNHRLVVARFTLPEPEPQTQPRMLRLSTHRGSLVTQSTGQVWGHSAARNAFAIAAVDVGTAGGGVFVGGAPNPAEWFSSDGPRRIFFEPDGTPITPDNFLSATFGGLLRQKPEFAAADGVSTATPDFNPFHGTSAAAPHAAALAALLLEGKPEIAALGNASATTIARNLMRATSLDIEAPGFDRDSGAGILMADGLVDPCDLGQTNCNDGNPCTQTDTCQAGTCVGSNPVVCPTADQCHLAGSCNVETGECEVPELADGTDCDDGDACTQSDSCQSGQCTGAQPVICAASDDCHLPGSCNPDTGECSNPAADDDTDCDDGNACTQSDSCQSGQCTGAQPVICAASDDCHLPGSCNPDTGECSNPAADDDTDCDDGNACTQSDSCQSGQCTGAQPVICAASDDCHLPGSCNPDTGGCSNPAADDDTDCDDGNACTQSDSCQSGQCTGAQPVICAASDDCHLPGSCNPDTGGCSNPAADDDTDCDDGNACTQSDSCQSGTCTGANPISCPAPGQCHLPSSCNPDTGECSNPEADDDTDCDDGNACTQSDSCQNGACTGAQPVICAASDDCHLPGICNPDTGECSNPEADDNTACDDGNACTQSDSCQSGQCTGANPISCPAPGQCHLPGTCNPDTGECSNPEANDNTACDDGNACTQSDSCQSGQCTGAQPVICEASDDCHLPGICNPDTGECSNPEADDNTDCDDGNACTQSDSCQSGACTGANPISCPAPGQCHLPGTCNPDTGECSNPEANDNTACDDGNACTQSDSCQSGQCTGAQPVICEASDDCHLPGICNPDTGECSNPEADDNTDCDDGNACTQADSCQSGACTGANPVVCTAPDQCHLQGSCDPGSGDCSNPEADDGTLCGAGECSAGQCVPIGEGGAGGVGGDAGGGGANTAGSGGDPSGSAGAEAEGGSAGDDSGVPPGTAGSGEGGGESESGGTTARGGNTAAGGNAAGKGGSGGDGASGDDSSSSDESSCGCRVPGKAPPSPGGALLACLAALAVARRRSSRRLW